MIKKVRSLLKTKDQPAAHEEDNMDEGTLELESQMHPKMETSMKMKVKEF